MNMTRLFIVLFMLFSATVTAEPLPAELGPVGPKSDSTSAGDEAETHSTAKPAVDLPYKPSGGSPKESASAGKGAIIEEREPDIEIPFILSKSPEPLGAADPEF